MTEFLIWIWQGLVITAAAALVVRILPRANASTRHAIWWCALVIVLVCRWLPPGAPPESAAVAPPLSTAADALLSLPTLPTWLPLATAAIWMLVASWGISRMVLSLRTVASLKQNSTAFDPAQERRLPLWQSIKGTGRPTMLRVSERVGSACALGFSNPAIVLPRHLVDCLTDAELDQVIAHEHAHVLRHDDWLRLAQCAIAALFGLHPAVWIIGRRLDLERETACDDRVVALTGAAKAYAECLARVASLMIAGSQTPQLVPAAVRSRGLLRSRVVRLLDRNGNRAIGIRWPGAVLCAAALGGIAAVCEQAPPLIAFAGDSTGLVVLTAVRTPSIAPSLPMVLVAEQSKLPAETPAPANAQPVVEAQGSITLRPVHDVAAVNVDVLERAATTPAVGDPAPIPSTTLAAVLASGAPGSDGAALLPPGLATRSWSVVSANVTRASVTTARSTRRAGETAGRWFARAASLARRPSSP